MRAVEEYLHFPILIEQLKKLSKSVEEQDCDTARQLLIDIVLTYEPTSDINDLVWAEKLFKAEREKLASNVTQLAAR